VGFRSREERISMGEELRERVRERYAEAARSVKVKDGGGGYCDSSCCGSEAQSVDLTAGSYSAEEHTGLPEDAVGRPSDAAIRRPWPRSLRAR
jgi:hypothetical protein